MSLAKAQSRIQIVVMINSPTSLSPKIQHSIAMSSSTHFTSTMAMSMEIDALVITAGKDAKPQFKAVPQLG